MEPEAPKQDEGEHIPVVNRSQQAETVAVQHGDEHEPKETTRDEVEVESRRDEVETRKYEYTPATVAPPPEKVDQAGTVGKSSGPILVLQWLTYAFWGWTIIAMTWLAGITVRFLLSPDKSMYSEPEAVAYPLAASVVLLTISLLTDFFYSRHEVRHKTGAESIIMVVHAVIFALAGIGALITAVFSGIMLILENNSASNGPLITLVTAGIIFALFLLALIRTVKPFLVPKFRLIFSILMVLVTVVGAVIGIVGPAAYTTETKSDRLIEENLQSVADGINDYYDSNAKLPAKLTDVTFRKDAAKQLVESNLVEYVDQGKQASVAESLESPESPESPEAAPVSNYRLCVTYKSEKKPGYYSDDYISEARRSSYVNTYEHKSGRVCYELQTESSYSYPPMYPDKEPIPLAEPAN